MVVPGVPAYGKSSAAAVMDDMEKKFNPARFKALEQEVAHHPEPKA